MKLDPGALNYLRDLTRATVDASRVRPGERVGASPQNTTGDTLIRPGGRDCYPAYWVRDFAMSLASGFITTDEVRHALAITARTQNGPAERRLRNGAAVIPPWAVVDHVNFDGGAVFYPGTMSAGDDQGGEPFGARPPVCDHFYFAEIAHHLWKTTGPATFLRESDLLDRLHRAFAAPDADEQTGAVVTNPSRRAVGFGFYDVVYLTGSLLFPTLLRYRAAGMLADLSAAANDNDRADQYRALAGRIRENLPAVFTDPDQAGGWLIASTEMGRQPDVWGTLYALYLGLLPADVAAGVRDTIANAVRDGTIVHKAGVRHLPTDADHSPESAWQQTAGSPRGTYQNGAYWHTPTGWLIAVLADSHPGHAAALFDEYVRELKADDFRQGPQHGAPWECFGLNGQHRQNPVYMTSAAVPYAVLRDLSAKE